MRKENRRTSCLPASAPLLLALLGAGALGCVGSVPAAPEPASERAGAAASDDLGVVTAPAGPVRLPVPWVHVRDGVWLAPAVEVRERVVYAGGRAVGLDLLDLAPGAARALLAAWPAAKGALRANAATLCDPAVLELLDDASLVDLSVVLHGAAQPELGACLLASGADRVHLAWAEADERGLRSLRGASNLRALDLEGSRPSVAGLQHLAALPALRSLSLARTSLGDAALPALARLSGLRALDLSNTRVTQAGLPALASLPELLLLDLALTGVGPGLKPLRALPALQELRLGWTMVDDRAAEVLVALPRLRVLELSNTAVGDATMAALAGLPELRWLMLNQTRVTDRGLQALAGRTRLLRLDAVTAGVSGAGIERLSTLRWLELEGSRLHPEAAAGIGTLRGLRKLVLTDARLAGPGLLPLAELEQLRELALDGAPLADADLLHLAPLRRLERVSLRRTAVTAAGSQRLRSWLPRVAVVLDAGPQRSARGSTGLP